MRRQLLGSCDMSAQQLWLDGNCLTGHGGLLLAHALQHAAALPPMSLCNVLITPLSFCNGLLPRYDFTNHDGMRAHAESKLFCRTT